MQGELPRVDRGKEILPQPRNQKRCRTSQAKKKNDDQKSVPQTHREQISIGLPKLFKPAIEFAIKSPENLKHPNLPLPLGEFSVSILAVFCVIPSDPIHRQGRNQRSR